MNIQVESVSPVTAKMKILIPAAEVNQKFEAYFGSLAKNARIPGFRPGKAPTAVVKKYYFEDSASDFSERLIAEYVMRAVQERKFRIVSAPVLLATDLPQENRDFGFEVELELRPTPPELSLQGLEISSAPKKEVTEDDVLHELEHFRENQANFVDLVEERGAQNSDLAVINFEGTHNGKKPDEMKAENYSLVLGQGQFIPGFEAAVLGMKPGEQKTFEVTFPEDYQSPELQGSKVEFQVSLLQLKQKQLPELDDEFAKTADSETQTLEELKKKVRAKLELEHREAAEAKTREQVADWLVQKHPFSVSERQVENLAQRIAEDAHHTMHRMGIKHEENEDHAKTLLEASRKKAERDIKLTYILEQIAEEQKIEVSADDIQKRFEKIAARTGLSIAQIKSFYTKKDPKTDVSKLEDLKGDIQDEKSLDYALSKATIKTEGQNA